MVGRASPRHLPGPELSTHPAFSFPTCYRSEIGLPLSAPIPVRFERSIRSTPIAGRFGSASWNPRMERFRITRDFPSSAARQKSCSWENLQYSELRICGLRSRRWGHNSATAPASASTAFLLYRISFSAAGETVQFFANSVPGNQPVTPTLTFSVPEGSFASTFTNIRFQSGDQPANFDEVRIGTTYADVTPVPEPTAVAAMGAGALALLRRRRRQS